MDSLTSDPRFFAQITSAVRTKPELAWASGDIRDYVIEAASSVLGADFEFNVPIVIDDSEPTGLTIYDALTNLLPFRSPQSKFFWQKLGKPFASMLETAGYPLSSQVTFLTFIHARILGMMGPLDARGPGSLMTFDGSPVELSWVIPSKEKSGNGGANRQLRFAIEPIDPRTGRLLRGAAVLRYLTSGLGSLGLVRCEKGALDWSDSTDDFLYSDEDRESGNRFFIGFDFAPSGDILLKTYYLPSLRRPSDRLNKRATINMWDVDYNPLRGLLSGLDPALIEPLETMISYVDDLDDLHKPRIQIISMDCIRSEANRLKLYCRPSRGNSWSDAQRAFTLGGRLSSPELNVALGRLETLWNLLFPFAHSHSDQDLDDFPIFDDPARHPDSRTNSQHPTGGLLYYYSLVPGSHMVLPKIYLPVARYCANDLVIAQAIEQFHATDHRRVKSDARRRDPGWVSKEISSAYNHRGLSERSGIHTYVTFALKQNYEWEVTSYFSPEVWEA